MSEQEEVSSKTLKEPFFVKKLHQKNIEKLENWLHRLEQMRAGSIFDNHCELGMKYVLRKLLGKDTEDLEKQALKWRDRLFKENYKRIDLANFKKDLVVELQKRLKQIDERYTNKKSRDMAKLDLLDELLAKEPKNR